MYAPLAVSSLTLAASVRDAAGGGALPLPRAVVNGLALATGIVGTGFHLYNITKRPGGFGWLNLFYAAPLGAPAALSLAGLLGTAADRLRRGAGAALRPAAGRPGVGRPARHRRRGRAAAFPRRLSQSGDGDPDHRRPRRGGAVGASCALGAGRDRRLARWALRLLAGIGFAGSAFHAYGIQRNMGGWRNWSQNLLNGPPLPAPPAFTALAIAGLAALRLIEEETVSERFPGYDVLAKRHTPSWNEKTRRVIDQRLALPREPRFLAEPNGRRSMRSARDRAAAEHPAAGADCRDGRHEAARKPRRRLSRPQLPPLREAWQRGLRALDAEARRTHGVRF